MNRPWPLVWRPSPALALLAAALLAPAPRAAAGVADPRPRATDEVDAPPAKVAEARAVLVRELNKLAGWCNTKHLFLERDRIWRRVLAIDADDATARKGLRYARNIDGTWKEPEPREQKNLDVKALAELPAREVAAGESFGDALLAMARDERTSGIEREALIAELVAHVPDHAGYRAWIGDVRMEERWVLPETAQGKVRRPELRESIQRQLALGAQLTADAPRPDELAMGFAWTCVLQGSDVRVLATTDEEHARAVGAAVQAVAPLLAELLGGPMRCPPGYTIYVLNGDADRAAFLGSLRDVPAAERARLAALESAGVPNSSNVALFTEKPERRLDAAVRHTIGHVLGESVHLDTRTGWLWEGFGLYVTRELVGTRHTWFVNESTDPESLKLRQKLMLPGTNWIQEAYVSLCEPTAPPLSEILVRDMATMDVPSVLASYALSAYLLEGRPVEAGAFVRHAAARETPDAVAQAALKLSADELHVRLVRWLSERK